MIEEDAHHLEHRLGELKLLAAEAQAVIDYFESPYSRAMAGRNRHVGYSAMTLCALASTPRLYCESLPGRDGGVAAEPRRLG